MSIKKLLTGFLAILTFSLFIACEKDNSSTDVETNTTTVTTKFKVDIPSALSKDLSKSATLKNAEGDTIQGDDIYELLNLFIAVGEGSADLVEGIVTAIKMNKVELLTDITYLSEEDFRMKHMTVEADVEFKSQVWEYMLTTTDFDSESNSDGGIGLQFFWNNDPLVGIAIVKPYNINRIENADDGESIYSVEYSSAGNDTYDEYMLVEIADLITPGTLIDTFALESLKMFVGKKGDIVDVYGNSNHPNAQFDYESGSGVSGFNWAFVASGHETKNIGVAEVGLPASTADISTREAILVDNSIESVFNREITNAIKAEYPSLTSQEISDYVASYLVNTQAPGYFNSNGFIQAATAPNSDYNELTSRIANLTPYNPSTVNGLSISFK